VEFVRLGRRGARAEEKFNMTLRTIVSGTAAATLLLISGAAFPGGQTTTDDQLVDFNPSTGELWAYPKGQSMATYLHSHATRHLLADLSRFTPPDPCFPLAIVWNNAVRHDAKHGVVSTRLFERLLVLQSRFQCTASLTSVDGTPQPLLSVTPTAQ
jgi:hypothetical protein